MRFAVLSLLACVAPACKVTNERPPAAPTAQAAVVQPVAADAVEVPKVTAVAPPKAAPDSCEQLRVRFYALQQSSLACDRDDQCDCVDRIEVSGGGLLGALTSAAPGLRALAKEYSGKKCPISCRSSEAPVCHARCVAGACAP
jgi:hypothetical protein